MDYRNLVTRTIFGAILVATIVAAILISAETFVVFFALLGAAINYEFLDSLMKIKSKLFKILSAVWVAYVVVAFYTYSELSTVSGTILLAVFPIWVVAFLAFQLLCKEPGIEHIQAFSFGLVYTVLPMVTFVLLPFYEGNYVAELPVFLFAFIWINDTFAYLSGSLFGKYKMCERISPKKTWEGFVGGNVFTLLAAVGVAYCCPILNIWQWLVVAQLVVVFGTAGDFFESLIKRVVGVKDSGNIIPGHGGLLDRFDSFLFAAPAVFAFVVAFA